MLASCDSFERWRVAFSQSGGIAGLARTLELDSSGRAVVTERGERRTAQDVDPRELLRIHDLLAQACPFEGVPSAACRDCFLYDMTIELDGARYEARTDDIALAGTEMQALVRALRVRLAATLR